MVITLISTELTTTKKAFYIICKGFVIERGIKCLLEYITAQKISIINQTLCFLYK